MNNDTSVQRIPKRILNTLLSSLAAGVVPRTGAPYVAIGRKDEIAALLSDLEQVNEGGGTMRFVIGRYGSGKSFLIQLIRGYALERDFVTADADLSPERRLYGTGGSGVATYRELIKNLASKSSLDGGALTKIIARWIDAISSELMAEGIDPDSANFSARLNVMVVEKLASVRDLVGGFDFATVINKYYRALTDGNDTMRSACLRWLRGEYLTKTEAKRELGTQGIINDDNWYDYLKLLAVFVKMIGYKGMMVYIDECVNLYKITNRISRENNYEKLLSIFNDTLQGKAPHLGFIFVGTPQFLEDTRRGLFSYDALRSRLADSVLINGEFKNLAGPVIRLVRLTDSELFALITRINRLYSDCYAYQIPLTSAQMQIFLSLCLNKAGSDSMITPREIIRSYISLLHILRQNPEARFETVISGISDALKPEKSSDPDETDNTELSDFEL